jgi:branched-chain amino acid transport system substrate-binding protein
MTRLKKMTLAACAGAMGAGLIALDAAPVQAQVMEQFMPIPIYRTGPYAAGGTGYFGGFMDYMALINERDGGINGVKLTWEECETAYDNARGVECYERLKGKGPTGGAMFHPLSTGITYSTFEKGAADKLPVVSLGYGRGDAMVGSVFPYLFPLVTTYWSQNTAKIKFIAMKEGGMDKLKGKKLANVYHDSAYGKETIDILNKQASMYGFEIKHFPVAHPGLDQKAVWLQIKQMAPDWVILRGWGVMNPTAIKEAQRIGFAREKMLGVWWSGSEEDMLPAGPAAKGFFAAGFHPAGKEFPVLKEIQKHVYSKKKGNVEEARIGSIYYNRGVVTGILSLEAIRVAQEKYGKKPLTGEQVQWGLEHLNLTAERIKALGGDGLVQPIKTSCNDHEGGGAVKFQQWDGAKWIVVSDWIEADKKLVRPLAEESAMKYAKEKNITPRDCSKEG